MFKCSDGENMRNEDLLQKAQDAIDDLFSDQSVTVETAIENMETLKGDIDSKLDALANDLELAEKPTEDD